MADNVKANKMNSQADDDIGFGIYTDIADLPMTGCPSYIEEGIGGVCESGTATIVVFDVPFQIVPNVVITLMPWQLVFIKEISEDFRITFFKISKDMFSETLSTLWRPASGFLLYMRKHIVSIPDGELIGRFLAYCNLLVYRMKHTPQNCRQESIMQLLRVYFWDVYTVYINDPQAEKSLKFTRKDEYVTIRNTEGMPVKIQYLTNAEVLVLYDTYAAVYDTADGTELYRYSYGGRTLQSAAISAGKNAVLLFGDGVHGALTQLTILDATLSEAGSADVNERASGVAASRTGAFVLTNDGVLSYGLDGVFYGGKAAGDGERPKAAFAGAGGSERVRAARAAVGVRGMTPATATEAYAGECIPQERTYL